jgi:RNA polymerase sigma-70 factor (ECF subfamily)
MHSWLKMQLVGNRIPVANRPVSASEPGTPSLNESAPDARRASEPDFSDLYVKYFDVAWRALRRYGVPAEELEDALQEVFLIVHARLPSFEGRSSLRTWVFGISRRVARDHRPTARLEICDPGLLDEFPDGAHAGPHAGPGTDAAMDAEQRDNARILYALLAELSPERREMIVLVELEHMTVAEVAEILSENPNTLQSRLRAARADLSSAWARRMAAEDWRRGCAANNRP